MTDRIFSGDQSKDFWKAVSRIEGPDHAIVMSYGCKAQDMEADLARKGDDVEGADLLLKKLLRILAPLNGENMTDAATRLADAGMEADAATNNANAARKRARELRDKLVDAGELHLADEQTIRNLRAKVAVSIKGEIETTNTLEDCRHALAAAEERHEQLMVVKKRYQERAGKEAAARMEAEEIAVALKAELVVMELRVRSAEAIARMHGAPIGGLYPEPEPEQLAKQEEPSPTADDLLCEIHHKLTRYLEAKVKGGGE